MFFNAAPQGNKSSGEAKSLKSFLSATVRKRALINMPRFTCVEAGIAVLRPGQSDWREAINTGCAFEGVTLVRDVGEE